MANNPSDLKLKELITLLPSSVIENFNLNELIELLPHPILTDFKNISRERKKLLPQIQPGDSENILKSKKTIREYEAQIAGELAVIDALYRAIQYTVKGDEMEHKYKETGNPLYAWHAYLACRPCRDIAASPLPGWIMNYLDEVAERVLATTDKEYSAQTAEYILGFRKNSADDYKGGGIGPVTQCIHNEKKEAVVKLIKKRKLANPKASIDSICQELESEGLEKKWETIRKWYYTSKKKSG